jgi:hypothetical protein
MAYYLANSQRTFCRIQELSGEEAKELLAALAANDITLASADYRSVRDAVEDALATLQSRQRLDTENVITSQNGNGNTEATNPVTTPKSREIRWCVYCQKSYCAATMIPGDCKYHSGKSGSLVLP